MSEPIISVSGLRGIVGESLTPEVAMRFAAAFAACLPPGRIVVSRDSRPSGALLADIIRGTLRAAGREVIHAGIAATPTTGILVRHHGCVGGIQVSASHNPAPYNGIKLFSAEGRVLTASAGQQVIDQYRQGRFRWADHQKAGSESLSSVASQTHAAFVLKMVDVDRIRRRRFKVLLDSNHGAGGLLGTYLLDELGCQITLLGGPADGQFAHAPEPTAENLVGVCNEVTAAQADVGFCQDPDADRLAIIDAMGRYVGEECTLALCLDHVLRRRKGPIVINCATSSMSADLADKYKVPLYRSAVGEAYVVDSMLKHRAVFGGEGNGGPIDPQVGHVRDSFVGMALVLDAMAQREQSVSQLVDNLPRWEIHKAKVTLGREKILGALTALERHFSNARPDHLDGIRLDWPDQWLLVRASNTEPIVRIIAEAKSNAAARQLAAEAAKVLSG